MHRDRDCSLDGEKGKGSIQATDFKQGELINSITMWLMATGSNNADKKNMIRKSPTRSQDVWNNQIS